MSSATPTAGWVSFELGGELFVEGVELAAAGQVGANHVLQGAGDEEELLFQPQLLALNLLVVGVEDFGDVLGDGLCCPPRRSSPPR